MRILVVEDHADLAANLVDWLEAQNCTVTVAADGNSALQHASQQGFDAVVLDRMIPAPDGLQVCQSLRAAGVSTPILLLTALDSIDNRVEGLAAGADDYLIKPFAMSELWARLQALQRRASGQWSAVLKVGDLAYHPQQETAHRGGQPLALTPTLRTLLEVLMRASPHVVKRERLEWALWQDQPPTGDVLRAHMHNLRLVIDQPFETKLLHSVYGSGYRLHVA
jgi:DNA-binding response OmpR family regulator